MTINELERIATQVRRDIIRMTHGCQSGHPGGSLGATDVVTALYFDQMHIDPAMFRMDGNGGLSQDGAEGSERFDGFFLADEAQARKILLSGRDERGMLYSTYTWMGLCWFVSGLWKTSPASE